MSIIFSLLPILSQNGFRKFIPSSPMISIGLFFVFRSWIPTAQGPSGIPRSYRQQGQTGPFHLQSARGRAQFNFQGKAHKFQCDLEIDFFSLLQTLLQTFLFTFSCMYSKTFLLYNSSFFESYTCYYLYVLPKSSILHEIAWFYVDGFSYWVAQIDSDTTQIDIALTTFTMGLDMSLVKLRHYEKATKFETIFHLF